MKEERRSALDYFRGDDIAADKWKDKYAMPGEINPDDMHKRMAKEFARIENNYIKKEKDVNGLSKYGDSRSSLTEDIILNYFKDFKYIVPQGSIMSMLGVDKIGSLSNCFVVGQPHDSYGGILEKDQQLAQLMKRRGGVGVDISTLRPSGTAVTNSAGTSTGAVSFMERFSNTTREVAQNGRRGALMITMDCRHPDIFDFVSMKKDRTKVTGANVSVMLRDDFMEAVKNDEDYILRFPCDAEVKLIPNKYNKGYHNLETGIYTKKIKAKELYDSIVENAHDNAEPGQMFIDKHWNYSPDGVYPEYKGVTTNPCGEIFMQPYDACRLMALNLLSFVDNPYTKDAEVDWVKLYETAYEQQRLADDLVDLELEHISRILAKIHSDPGEKSVKEAEIKLWENIFDVASAGRRTGCGFTALGDTLAALGVKYDSYAGQDFIDKLMATKMEAELDCSIDLAILRGHFKGWDDSLEENGNDFYNMLEAEFPVQVARMSKYGRRNISWNTVAPTGTVSLMTQTTSGLEPLFMPYYTRRVKVNPGEENVRIDFTDENGDNWMEYPILHPQFIEWYRQHIYGTAWDAPFWYGEYMDVKESLVLLDKESLDKTFEISPWYGACAPDIDWKKRIDVQAIIQKYTSHSISSTINLPNNVSKEEVADIYLYAHEAGLKGVTIYRDGCRTGVLINDTVKEDDIVQHDAPKRPKELPCDIHHLVVKGVPWTVLVGKLGEKPYEIFAFHQNGIPKKENKGTILKKTRGKYDLITENDTYPAVSGKADDEQEAIARLVSTSLRHGANIQYVSEQLTKTNGDITSFSKALSRTLKKYVSEDKLLARSSCDDCGSDQLIYEEGCMKCKNCGGSKCG